jgi:hypothetical protein
MSVERWCPAATARGRSDSNASSAAIQSFLLCGWTRPPRGVVYVVVDGVASDRPAGGWHVQVGGVVGVGVPALHHGQCVSLQVGA